MIVESPYQYNTHVLRHILMPGADDAVHIYSDILLHMHYVHVLCFSRLFTPHSYRRMPGYSVSIKTVHAPHFYRRRPSYALQAPVYISSIDPGRAAWCKDLSCGTCGGRYPAVLAASVETHGTPDGAT